MTNPQLPPETVALYRALFEAVHRAARANAELTPEAAVSALVSCGIDIAIASGALWASADFIDNLRELADQLACRKAGEPAPPLLPTLAQTLASARPAFSH